MRKIALWGVALLAGYIVLATGVGLFIVDRLLTAGVIDWRGENQPAPDDPMTIGYRGDPQTALSWTYETVNFSTENGSAEAWLVTPQAVPESTSDLWAIWVHGIGGTRENGYRMLAPLVEAGVPVLMITYRNDRGAPPAPDGLYSFGLTEWRDLEGAVDWVLSHGAGRVAIVAESMGAAVTGQYLSHADSTDKVAGLAFDAPALDVPEILRAGGRSHWVPLTDLIVELDLAAWSWFRPDLRQAVTVDAIAKFDGPVFIAHGTRDPLVPYAVTEKLAAQKPDIMLFRTAADRHPLSFEEDRAGYSAALKRWLDRVRTSPLGQ